MGSLTGVAQQLKATAPFSATDLVTNRFTRTLATDGYARVNPFEVNKGNAPSEEAAPHSADDWDGYDHDRIESGGQLTVEVGYQQLTISWARHAGYNDALCRQLAYIKAMGASEDLSVNPFDTPLATEDAGDGTSHTFLGLTAGQWYALGLKAEFNDSDAAILPPDSTACDPDASSTPLIGAGEGISSGGPVFDDTPSLDGSSQNPQPADCFSACSGTDCPDVTIQCTMEGPSTGRLERSTSGSGGPFSLVDSSVGAGASSIFLSDQSPDTYWYRLRYNDLGDGSPGPWSNVLQVTVECDQI